MLKINEIYNMDCIEGLKLIDDKSIDLVVIDPPYLLSTGKTKKTSKFNNYQNDLAGMTNGFDLKILDLLIQKMKKINMYIYCSRQQVRILLNYFKDKGCNNEILVWIKSNPSPLCNNVYLPDTEYVLFFREKGVRLYGSYNTKRKWHMSGCLQREKKQYGHPTVKPIEFIQNHIINSSKEGDLVLDCFLGSGTTAVACINTGRNFIGFEKDKIYYEIAKARIQEAK